MAWRTEVDSYGRYQPCTGERISPQCALWRARRRRRGHLHIGKILVRISACWLGCRGTDSTVLPSGDTPSGGILCGIVLFAWLLTTFALGKR
jgi:hypothetical protein